jgi:hypothetical protein
MGRLLRRRLDGGGLERVNIESQNYSKKGEI